MTKPEPNIPNIPTEDITKKELFERVIRIEEKIDAMGQRNIAVMVQFRMYTVWILILIFIGLIMQIMIIL